MTRAAMSVRSEVAGPAIGHVCIHAAMSGTRMATPLLALSQGYSTSATGILVALFAVTQIFLSLPAGRFADRHGLQRPLAWCTGAMKVGIGIAAAWPIYAVICASPLVCGDAVGAPTSEDVRKRRADAVVGDVVAATKCEEHLVLAAETICERPECTP